MTREEALKILRYNSNVIHQTIDGRTDSKEVESLDMAIQALEAIKTLGDDMKLCQKSITDEKVLIGFNMAVALTNKHLSESEE